MNQPGPDATPAKQRRRTEGRQAGAWLAVAALAAAAVVGSNVSSVRERIVGSALPEPVVPATSRVLEGAAVVEQPAPRALRSTPWWQTVTSIEGEGATSVPITVDERAIDWRVTWSCERGHLRILAQGMTRPVVDADCPRGVGFADGTGPTELEVSAHGAWSIEVAQRVDVPLVEPLLPDMTAPATNVVATGTFRKAERVGAGKVTIYEVDRGYWVRLDDFWVNPKSSLQLRLSEAESPGTAEEFLAVRSQLLAALDVTAGSLNYQAPAGVDAEGFRSVVVWSPADNTVYATARLEVSA